MYRPSTYHISQASLEYFANRFNAIQEYKNVRWEYIQEETFDCDGFFIDICTGKTIGFDWEIRQNDAFSNGEFNFPTLGQYERKIQKESIDLSIQSDKEISSIIIAWHDDFKKEDVTSMTLATDTSEKENGHTRYTSNFKIYHIEDMLLFKKMIATALKTGIKNHTIFSDRKKYAKINAGKFYHDMDSQKCKFVREYQRDIRYAEFATEDEAKKFNLSPCKYCFNIGE